MIKIMCTVPSTQCKEYESSHNGQWKTADDFEKWLLKPGGIGGVHQYIVYSGAIKRKYNYNTASEQWERVLHPRGTKRKAKVSVPSAEVNKIEATPVKRSVIRHFYDDDCDRWTRGSFTYERLVELTQEQSTGSPMFTPYRVTFDDGSVTYFTRDGEGKPLYETSEDPTVKKAVETPPAPVSVPWHVAYLDIVNNGAKYTCVYKDGYEFELEEHIGYVKFKHNSRHGPLLVFKFTPSAVEADYYKKETK